MRSLEVLIALLSFAVASLAKKATNYVPVVCWKGHSGREAASQAFGPGCATCDVGDTCTFSLNVAATTALSDLEVVISGPSLHAGQVSGIDGVSTRFLVSYRIWDKGTYRVSILSRCATSTTSNKTETSSRNSTELGSWSLEVKRSTRLLPQGRPTRRLLIAHPTLDSTTKLQAPLKDVPSSATEPCDVGQYGRWLKKKTSDQYRWTPYGCAGKRVAKSDWVRSLNKRGIREINFIGSTPQRLLVMHLYYALTGKVDKRHRNAEYSFSYDVVVPARVGKEGKGYLRLNFYWVGSMNFGDHPQYGCRVTSGRRNIKLAAPNLPSPSSSANVWLLEAGQWTGEHCSSPEQALAAFLPHFFMWARRRVDNAATRKRRLPAWYLQAEAQASREPILVYRTTSPRPAKGNQDCGKGSPNDYVLAANKIEKSLIPSFRAEQFDAFETVSPRLDGHCPNSSQFSCVREVPGRTGQHYMAGDVGEATVESFVYFILNH